MDFKPEEKAWSAGWRYVAGIDEVGRGPLAGPVVAACVVFLTPEAPQGLADSKTLTPASRQRLFMAILSCEAAVGVGFASEAEIDDLNILKATHLAMSRAVRACPVTVDFALVDGLAVPSLPVPHRPIIKGDATCASIAAASVVAKVIRDQIMETLDADYPGYYLARNHGYPTEDHLKALAQLGPSPIHRRSFAPVARCGQSPLRLPFEETPSVVRGREGEAVARLYLERLGHKILASDYRSVSGEVDIISLDGTTLVFTEVKTSRGAVGETPAGRLTAAQQLRIGQSAREFLATEAPAHSECRFDVIEVLLQGRTPRIRHVPNAFDLSDT